MIIRGKQGSFSVKSPTTNLVVLRENSVPESKPYKRKRNPSTRVDAQLLISSACSIPKQKARKGNSSKAFTRMMIEKPPKLTVNNMSPQAYHNPTSNAFPKAVFIKCCRACFRSDWFPPRTSAEPLLKIRFDTFWFRGGDGFGLFCRLTVLLEERNLLKIYIR